MKSQESEEEREVLSTANAAVLAKEFRDEPDPFPYEEVPPSLLSSDHIEKYVLKTGLVSPFYLGGGRKARLKKASYEGRIGSKAYIFKEKELTSVLIPGKPLLVPANSIVFVESDLDFRLPNYIALRFNLQIRHVHRGLLLGTGPLVDPGYWGKLCIPLHNLTNADYEIPIEEGLFWVEFTKTTSDPEKGRVPLEEGKEYPEHWEIEKFLRKAAEPLVEGQSTVGIQSSIPMIVSHATKIAEEARDNSFKALDISGKAAKQAENAQSSAKDTSVLFNRIAWISALIVGIAVVTLWGTFYFGLRADINALQGKLDQAQSELSNLRSARGATLEQMGTQHSRTQELLDRLGTAEAEIRETQKRENELLLHLENTRSEIEKIRLRSSGRSKEK